MTLKPTTRTTLVTLEITSMRRIPPTRREKEWLYEVALSNEFSVGDICTVHVTPAQLNR